mgnify:FL=1
MRKIIIMRSGVRGEVSCFMSCSSLAINSFNYSALLRHALFILLIILSQFSIDTWLIVNLWILNEKKFSFNFVLVLHDRKLSFQRCNWVLSSSLHVRKLLNKISVISFGSIFADTFTFCFNYNFHWNSSFFLL